MSLAALTIVSGSLQTANAGGIGVSFQIGPPAAYYYPPQRVYTTTVIAPAPCVPAAPVVQSAPYYYAPPAAYYAPTTPVVVYSQPVYSAPVVVRPSYSPICIATPVIGFRFGFGFCGGYHHYRR